MANKQQKKDLEINLLPCPFCNAAAKFYENPWGVGVMCKNRDCGADVRDNIFNNTKSQAAKKWNRRT